MTATPGSANRAFLAWRTTASAMLLFWIPLPLLAESIPRDSEGFQDLAFVLLAILTYGVGVLVVIPLFAFTVGRWIDRRSAVGGLRRSVVTFGLYGLAFGLVLVLLLGFSALTPLGVLVLLLAPTLTALAGRVLMELKGRAWYIIIWATFALAVVMALALMGALIFNGRG